jgi:hypothetical protein
MGFGFIITQVTKHYCLEVKLFIAQFFAFFLLSQAVDLRHFIFVAWGYILAPSTGPTRTGFTLYPDDGSSVSFRSVVF